MNHRAVILRETAISVGINMVLSVLFFLAVFGMRAPVALGALGFDFLPQAFMVSLMGTLVPSLLLRRKRGGAAGVIVLRCLGIAIVAAILAGGGAYALCLTRAAQTIAPGTALVIKALFGGVLALIVTPLGVVALLNSVRSSSQ